LRTKRSNLLLLLALRLAGLELTVPPQHSRQVSATSTTRTNRQRSTRQRRRSDKTAWPNSTTAWDKDSPASFGALGGTEVSSFVAAAADLFHREGTDGTASGRVDVLLSAAALADDTLALLVEDAPCGGPSNLGSLLLLQEQTLVLGVDEVVDGTVASNIGATVTREDRVGAESAFNRPAENTRTRKERKRVKQ